MHKSVLLKEAIESLNIKNDGIYVDATLGYGGHSSKILEKLDKGLLICLDQDEEAISYSKKRLSEISNNFKIIKTNFERLKDVLDEINISKVDGILFDLGVSSPQIDNASRGFSFQKDSKLDMRMDQTNNLTAYDVVNNYDLLKLTDIFYKYGEEKKSKFIASFIVKKRPINTTIELVEVIKESVGLNYFNKFHPERKIFQAIRIEVNNELKVLEKVIPDAIELLNKGGRMAVISFHSLEDRIVKKAFKKYSDVDEIVKGMPNITLEYQPKIKLINKKPICPSAKEIELNSRSKSAKLRVIERI